MTSCNPKTLKISMDVMVGQLSENSIMCHLLFDYYVIKLVFCLSSGRKGKEHFLCNLQKLYKLFRNNFGSSVHIGKPSLGQ